MRNSFRSFSAGAVALLLTSLSPSTSRGNDWPQWRGPDRTDVSRETGLLKRWPSGGPKQLWVFREAGLGYAGPAIVGSTLFTMGARGENEVLIAVDISAAPKELWAAQIAARLDNDWGNGPRGTPCVDGDFVFAMGGQGTLLCASKKSGEVVWRQSMQDLGGKRPGWGYTESVLVDGDKVLCTPGGSKGAIVALDKKTGKVLWQSKEFTDGAQYASIIAAEHNGNRQYIQLTMQHIVGLGADTGDVLWKSDWAGKTAVIPTPIFSQGKVYVTAGYGVGCKMVRLGAGGTAETVYENRVMKNHHGGVVLVGDYLYGHSDGVGWVCQKFEDGTEVWSERSKLGKGCVTSADGMLYCVDEGSGAVALVAASPKGWEESGRFTLEPQTTQRSSRGKIWTHPVIANGKLFLRDQELVSCYDVKQP